MTDPKPERGTWSLYLWVPVVFAVAGWRLARCNVSRILYYAAVWVDPDSVPSPGFKERVNAKVEAWAAARQCEETGGPT